MGWCWSIVFLPSFFLKLVLRHARLFSRLLVIFHFCLASCISRIYIRIGLFKHSCLHSCVQEYVTQGKIACCRLWCCPFQSWHWRDCSKRCLLRRGCHKMKQTSFSVAFSICYLVILRHGEAFLHLLWRQWRVGHCWRNKEQLISDALPWMDVLMLADQSELICVSSVRTQVWKSCWEQWTIGTDRVRESGKSVRAVQLDDDDHFKKIFLVLVIYVYISTRKVPKHLTFAVAASASPTSYRWTEWYLVNCNSIFGLKSIHTHTYTHTHTHIYIYIYTYIYVCVCVFLCV